MSKIRWTVVTGASSGIGEEIARAFAAIGHHLILVARRKDRLDALADDIAKRHRGRVETIALDLEQPGAAAELFAAVEALGNPVHTLVNNAGFGLRGDFVDLPLADQLAMIRLNVDAATELCHLFLPGMIARKQGGIVNVASMASFQAGPHMAVYYATKAYLLSLSEALHEEVRPHGVTVTALCPGATESEFGERAGMGGTLLLKGRKMSAARVAQAAVDGYRAGHAIVVPGNRNALTAQISRLMPRFVSRKAAAMLQK